MHQFRIKAESQSKLNVGRNNGNDAFKLSISHLIEKGKMKALFIENPHINSPLFRLKKKKKGKKEICLDCMNLHKIMKL